MRPGHGKVFLDTNIFVYTFDSGSRAKKDKARELVSEALATRRGVISYQVVQEFLNVATRKFSRPMTASEAQLYLSRVLMPLCEVFPDSSLYSQALSVADETGWSFYDSLIVSSAATAGCLTLLSEDLQHGRTIRGVQIRNPFLTSP
jgi:predicted nucleic acid-binding protein